MSTPPFVTSEEHEKLRALLGGVVDANRVSSMIRILNRDPSLSLESISLGHSATPTSFVKCCIERDNMAGLVFASQQGFDFDLPLDGSDYTPLAFSVLQGHSGLASLLITLGCSPDSNHSEDPEHAPLMIAIKRIASQSGNINEVKKAANIGRMLVDAKARVDLVGPNGGLVAELVQADWHAEASPAILGLFGDLCRAGADLDSSVGIAKMSPIKWAAGKKNLPAVMALIRAGANTSTSHLGGEIMEILEANGFKEDLPAIQKTILEANANRAEREALRLAKQSAAAGGAAPSAAPPRPRRKISVL